MHRNSQKRIIRDGLVYFITTVTKDRFPYFENTVLCDLFIEEMKVCKNLKKFKLYSFCILPDHVHLMIEPGDKFNISKIMKSLKENFSRDSNKLLIQNDDYPEGDTSTCRLPIRLFIEQNRKNMNNDIPKFTWQSSYFDHYIRNDRDFEHHMEYTIWNFQKHGLPGNYVYSSMNFDGVVDG